MNSNHSPIEMPMHVRAYGKIVYKSRQDYDEEARAALEAARKIPMKLLETEEEEKVENDAFFF